MLDADIRLIPAERQARLLTLAGTYRPPGTLSDEPDRAIVRRTASVAIRNFLGRLAAEISGQRGPAYSTGLSLCAPARE